MMGTDGYRPQPVGGKLRQLLQIALADEGMVRDGERHFTDGARRLIRWHHPLRTFGLEADGDLSDVMQCGQGG